MNCDFVSLRGTSNYRQKIVVVTGDFIQDKKSVTVLSLVRGIMLKNKRLRLELRGEFMLQNKSLCVGENIMLLN